jgi:chromatin remodeling complex protein RSC6
MLAEIPSATRPQVAKKVWAYIKKHKLQDPKKRREIVADKKLKPVFGKARLDMFRMTKAISKHLSKEGSVRSEYSAKTTAACPLRNSLPDNSRRRKRHPRLLMTPFSCSVRPS